MYLGKTVFVKGYGYIYYGGDPCPRCNRFYHIYVVYNVQEPDSHCVQLSITGTLAK